MSRGRQAWARGSASCVPPMAAALPACPLPGAPLILGVLVLVLVLMEVLVLMAKPLVCPVLG